MSIRVEKNGCYWYTSKNMRIDPPYFIFHCSNVDLKAGEGTTIYINESLFYVFRYYELNKSFYEVHEFKFKYLKHCCFMPQNGNSENKCMFYIQNDLLMFQEWLEEVCKILV